MEDPNDSTAPSITCEFERGPGADLRVQTPGQRRLACRILKLLENADEDTEQKVLEKVHDLLQEK